MKNTVALALRVLGILLGLAWVCGTLAYVCNLGSNCPSPPSLLERATTKY